MYRNGNCKRTGDFVEGHLFLFDRKFLRNVPIKQNAPLRMRTRAIGIMSQKRPRSARESRKRDSFLKQKCIKKYGELVDFFVELY